MLDLTIPGDAAQQKVLTRLTGLCNSIAPEDLCEGEYVSPRLSLFEELQGLLDPRALAVFLRGLPPLELTLGEVRAYRGVDGDTLAIPVESDALAQLHRQLCKHLPGTSSAEDYDPKITLCKVRKGCGQDYAGDDCLDGARLCIGEACVTGMDGQEYVVRLGGTTLIQPKKKVEFAGQEKVKGAPPAPAQSLAPKPATNLSGWLGTSTSQIDRAMRRLTPGGRDTVQLLANGDTRSLNKAYRSVCWATENRDDRMILTGWIMKQWADRGPAPGDKGRRGAHVWVWEGTATPGGPRPGSRRVQISPPGQGRRKKTDEPGKSKEEKGEENPRQEGGKGKADEPKKPVRVSVDQATDSILRALNSGAIQSQHAKDLEELLGQMSMPDIRALASKLSMGVKDRTKAGLITKLASAALDSTRYPVAIPVEPARPEPAPQPEQAKEPPPAPEKRQGPPAPPPPQPPRPRPQPPKQEPQDRMPPHQRELSRQFNDYITASGVSEEAAADYLAATNEVVTRLNEKCVERITQHLTGGALFVEHTDDIAERMADSLYKAGTIWRWQKILVKYGYKGRVAGCYLTTAKQLIMDGAKNVGMSLRHIYAHEMAHAIDGPKSEYSKSKEWIDAFAREIKVPGNPLSKYAATEPSEGFAEFARVILYYPENARKLFPRCYRFWVDNELYDDQGQPVTKSHHLERRERPRGSILQDIFSARLDLPDGAGHADILSEERPQRKPVPVNPESVTPDALFLAMIQAKAKGASPEAIRDLANAADDPAVLGDILSGQPRRPEQPPRRRMTPSGRKAFRRLLRRDVTEGVVRKSLEVVRTSAATPDDELVLLGWLAKRWIHQPGPRSRNRYVNDATGRVAYFKNPPPGSVDNKGEPVEGAKPARQARQPQEASQATQSPEEAKPGKTTRSNSDEVQGRIEAMLSGKEPADVKAVAELLMGLTVKQAQGIRDAFSVDATGTKGSSRSVIGKIAERIAGMAIKGELEAGKPIAEKVETVPQPKTTEPLEATKAETPTSFDQTEGDGNGNAGSIPPGAKEIGRGNTGPVYRHGNTVYKSAFDRDGRRTLEPEVYESLRSIEGIAPGAAADNTVKLPFYDAIVSIDAVPRDQRDSMSSVVRKSIARINAAVTALSDAGYYYNDPLQFGVNADGEMDLLDFSNVTKTDPATARRDNGGLLQSFYSVFGMKEDAANYAQATQMLEAVSGIMSDDDPLGAYEAELGEDTVTKLRRELGGKAPRFAYYAASEIPVSIRGVGQAISEKGTNVVLSSAPLDKADIDKWSLTPAWHKPAPASVPSTPKKQPPPVARDRRPGTWRDRLRARQESLSRIDPARRGMLSPDQDEEDETPRPAPPRREPSRAERVEQYRQRVARTGRALDDA